MVYIGLMAFLYLFQHHYLYRPDEKILISPAQIKMVCEEVSIESGDGIMLRGWFCPVENSKYTVLFCHSNMGNISHYLDVVQTLHELELSVLLFDYRGYGQSGGNTTEDGTYLDAEAAWRYLIETKKTPPRAIIIWGRSLGGSIAARLAAEHEQAALVVESAFTSFPDLASDYYPYLPVKIIARYDYNTLEYIKRVSCPVMVVHSRDDEIIPFRHGRRLFEAAREPKGFLEITGGHNEGFLINGEAYRRGLEEFLDSLTRKNNSDRGTPVNSDQ